MRDVRTENVRECACGRAYEVYPMFCGDQSRCPQCRAELADRVKVTEREYDDRLKKNNGQKR